MNIPLMISWRNVPPSETLEQRIREEAAKLETFFDRVVSCRVAVEQPHLHKHKGRHYKIRIEVSVPGTVKDVVVTRDPQAHKALEDPYLAVGEAFAEARRQLKEHVKRLEPKTLARKTRRTNARAT